MWCGEHLVQNGNWVCLLVWSFEEEGGGIWGKQSPPVLLWGAITQRLIYLNTLILRRLLVSAAVFFLPLILCLGSFDLFSFNVSRINLLFFPLSDPKLGKYFLIEHHRRARGGSGHHYGVLCRVKHSIGRRKSYFSAIERASNGGEVAFLLLFGKTKWLALHRHVVHECWQTGLGT